MSDYADLIKALLACNAPGGFCDSCPYHYGGIPCLDLNKNAADAIESLQAQMPKSGKWIPDAEDVAWGNAYVRMRCSVCNATAHSNDWDRKFVLSEYCPHCGAKMEVE